MDAANLCIISARILFEKGPPKWSFGLSCASAGNDCSGYSALRQEQVTGSSMVIFFLPFEFQNHGSRNQSHTPP
jgi:hypothetical protein